MRPWLLYQVTQIEKIKNNEHMVKDASACSWSSQLGYVKEPNILQRNIEGFVI